jgi:hypothetical protein
MELTTLFQKYFTFLRDSIVARKATVATKSDTVNDPAGEGWIMVLEDATIVALPSGNATETLTLPLKALQILPIRFKRILVAGTDDVDVYILR